jgi:hypothetical protein
MTTEQADVQQENVMRFLTNGGASNTEIHQWLFAVFKKNSFVIT